MFGLFNRDGRRAKRLRQRGVPTRAVVTEARPAGEPGRWRVALLVEPAGQEGFVAQVETTCPHGQRPVRGGEAQVLHEPGAGRDILLVSPVPTEAGGVGDAGAGVAGLAGMFDEDGDIARVTHASITVNGVPVDPSTATGAAHSGMSRDALRDLAHKDPAGVAQEVLRRLGAGELAPSRVEVSEPVELTGDDADAVLEQLAAQGVLPPEVIEQIRRRRGT